METLLTAIGSVIVAVSFLPYLRDTVKGKVKPRIASWATWSLISVIATIAALSKDAYASAALTGSGSVVEILVLFFALKSGDKTYELIDGICQTIAIFGVAAWLLTSNPVWAILFNILADIFAAIPTFYHAWIAPYEEAWKPFIYWSFGSFLTIFGIHEFNFINAGFPIYFTLIALTIGGFIFTRQKMVKA